MVKEKIYVVIYEDGAADWVKAEDGEDAYEEVFRLWAEANRSPPPFKIYRAPYPWDFRKKVLVATPIAEYGTGGGVSDVEYAEWYEP